MNKSTKAILAVMTAWPAVYMLFFLGFVVLLFASFFTGRGLEAGSPQSLLRTVFALHLGTIGLLVALGIFYIFHLFRNDHIAANKKALWAIVLLMGNVISMPIYWYLYVWRDDHEWIEE